MEHIYEKQQFVMLTYERIGRMDGWTDGRMASRAILLYLRRFDRMIYECEYRSKH